MNRRHDRFHSAATWFAEFEPVIRRALGTRIKGSWNIDDLAQEVYLRLLRIRQPELVANPQAYLYRIAINVAEEWRQRSAQAFDHSSDGLSDLESAEAVGDGAEQAEREDRVRSSLAELPSASQTALILHTRDGMTYGEIAAHMGITQRAVKRYIANGYAGLRERLHAFAPQTEKLSSTEDVPSIGKIETSQ